MAIAVASADEKFSLRKNEPDEGIKVFYRLGVGRSVSMDAERPIVTSLYRGIKELEPIDSDGLPPADVLDVEVAEITPDAPVQPSASTNAADDTKVSRLELFSRIAILMTVTGFLTSISLTSIASLSLLTAGIGCLAVAGSLARSRHQKA